MPKAFTTGRKLEQVNRPLTPKEEAFCRYYIELNNGQEAAIRAGYAPKSAGITANKLLNRTNVYTEIQSRREQLKKDSIASAAEVMEYFTGVMRGEIQDQFGLDASLADRTKAGIELAKRTVDMDNRAAGKADAKVEIKLDWKRD